MKNAKNIIVTIDQLSAAFTEWERRFREEPARFQSESEKAAGTAQSYGDAAAPYLFEILEQQAAQLGSTVANYTGDFPR